MKTKLIYVTEDGHSFFDEKLAKLHEQEQKELAEKLNDMAKWPDAELEKLVYDLKRAQRAAYNPEVIDDLTIAGRSVLYMKNVCEAFIEKHKNIKKA